MIKVIFGKRVIKNVPSNWDEVKPKVYEIFVNEFFLQRENLFTEDPETGKWYSSDVIGYEAIRLQILQAILGLSNKDFEKIGIDQRHKLIYKEKLVDFIFDKEPQKQPIEYFNNNLSKYFGPIDFHKISAEEFSFSDMACTAFIKTTNPKYLDTLISILFRPKKHFWFIKSKLSDSDGDIRQPFNKHLIDNRLKIVEKFNLSAKLAAFWWFHTQRCKLQEKYPHLFTNSNQTQAYNVGWLSVILSLSKAGTFGNYEKTCRTSMHLLLTDLNIEAAKQTDK
jgi:hypothetical protein